jgi:hypothetical protein
MHQYLRPEVERNVVATKREPRLFMIIALQPSIFTSNTPLTGKVGRIVEIYNPNPLMTFGGMGSQKLVGPNIEYITNNDSHLRAPYNSEFRDLVKSEIARLAAEPVPDTAQAKIPDTSNADHRQ